MYLNCQIQNEVREDLEAQVNNLKKINKYKRMRIIIPMAGWGSRLRPHTLTVPKPMLKIAGQSIVERLVSNICKTVDQKIDGISFIIRNDFGTTIEKELLAIAEKYNTTGHIFYQEEPLGTAHAIFCAQDTLQGPLIVGFADTMFEADFRLDQESDAVIWVKQIEDPSAFGVIALDQNGLINGFVEKPTTFVSDLAIIGIYYFKDGAKLRKDISHVIEKNIMDKGEYQLTTVLENMRIEGLKMRPGTVNQWLDCGNKNATVESNREVLIKDNNKISASAQIINSQIIPPCFVDEHVVIKNAIVGPYVSIGKDSIIEDCVIKDALIQDSTKIVNKILSNTMIGSKAVLIGKPEEYSLGDYSQIQ